jgi:hypothetical protein
MAQDPDEELLAELRSVVAERPPDAVVEGAKAAFAWRTIDAELADLAHDSALEEAGMRAGEAGARLLTFEAGDLAVEIEVEVGGERGRRVMGQVVPPQPARVEVVHAGGTVTAAADALGRFTGADGKGGPVRLRLALDGGRVVETAWVVM